MNNIYAALNQTEYRLKVTIKSQRWGISQNYFVISKYKELRLIRKSSLNKLSVDDISAMTKAEWKSLMPRIERFCATDWQFKDVKYTLSFEKAFSYNDVVVVYYEPINYPGTLTLSQLKKELKSSGIPIAATEQDKQYHKYGNATKVYRLYILKQYKDKLDRYLESAKNYGNISYTPPRY